MSYMMERVDKSKEDKDEAYTSEGREKKRKRSNLKRVGLI